MQASGQLRRPNLAGSPGRHAEDFLDFEDFALFGDEVLSEECKSQLFALDPQTLPAIRENRTRPASSRTQPRESGNFLFKVGSRKGKTHDTYSSSDEASDLETDAEIKVGPSELANGGSSLSELSIPVKRKHAGKNIKPTPIKSTTECLVYSEIRLLTKARKVAPLSFGSAKHVSKKNDQPCRPCMFESQKPGRCKRSWLCDFCHMNHPRSRLPQKQDPAVDGHFETVTF